MLQRESYEPMTERRDKMLSAVHEAGHVVVSAAYGLGVRAWIERRPAAVPEIERTWTGTATQCCRNYYTKKTVKPSKKVWTQIAVAGIVAEMLHDDPHGDCADYIIDMWQCGAVEPSHTDIALMSASWKRRRDAAEQAITILKREQALFAAVVAALIEHEGLTDGQIGKLAEKLLTEKKGKRDSD